jgi:hypothetical protein
MKKNMKQILLLILLATSFISVNACDPGWGQPTFPTGISGPPNMVVCGPGTAILTTPLISNAESYTWSVTGTGLSIISGQGTNSVTVSATSAFDHGTVHVYASNCNGSSGGLTRYVYGKMAGQLQMIIFSKVALCGGNTYTYAVVPNAAAASYTWSGPAGAIVDDGTISGNSITTTHTTVSITFPVGFISGDITVYGTNACGNSTPRVVTVRSGPPQPIAIYGPTSNLCGTSGRTYTINPVAGAISYNWTTPAGATINSGNGSTSIDVTYDASFTLSGNICVTPIGVCGPGSIRCQNVTPRPAQPGIISGPANPCKSSTAVGYSVPPISGGAAITYTWQVSGGATVVGSGANATVDFSGDTVTPVFLTVYARNSCGFACAPRTLSLAVDLGCRMAGTSASGITETFSAFPNPASGKINLSFNVSEQTHYSFNVVDLAGRTLIREKGFAEPGDVIQEIDLSNFAKGIYFLNLEKEGTEQQTIKIAVQ